MERLSERRCSSMGMLASSPWSTQDKALEATFIIADCADWQQTRDICRHPGLYEADSIMGRHPGASTINKFFLVQCAVHVLITDHLEGKWRTAWQCVWIVSEVTTVERNYKLGLHFSF